LWFWLLWYLGWWFLWDCEDCEYEMYSCDIWFLVKSGFVTCRCILVRLWLWDSILVRVWNGLCDSNETHNIMWICDSKRIEKRKNGKQYERRRGWRHWRWHTPLVRVQKPLLLMCHPISTGWTIPVQYPVLMGFPPGTNARFSSSDCCLTILYKHLTILYKHHFFH
jgi:hypothetical protein